MLEQTSVDHDLDVRAERYVQQRGAAASDAERRRLREEFIRDALPFAGRLAGRYYGRGEPAEDLDQVARIGLVKTVDRYDADRGSFTAFAVVTIRGELRRHFRDHTWGVHVPRRLQDLGVGLNRATGTLSTRYARVPTDEELAGFLGVGEADVRAARMSLAAYLPISLNRQLTAEEEIEFGDLFGAPDPSLAAVDDRAAMKRLLQRLPQRDRRLLALRYWGNLTQAEIAEQFGISQMQVSRLLARALAWLRTALLSDVVPPWPGATDEPEARVVLHNEPGGTRHAYVHGEVDRDGAADLQARLLSALCAGHPRRLVVDLCGVPSMDAAGLRALAAVHTAALGRRVELRVTGVTPHLAHLMTATGLGFLLRP
ncbi:sigma-70 family RNA polymerase sigma factor [Catenuloplanes atrovinosus]|uniref:RNA polymerase sigma-B factor n=1 Tax=Catenuloplanes atrovinosus TaxID=137266 RepID=A0AAE3YVS9_9ACTN|nr:sigma-70 family RNA polymerase sigma factor [Catenuloplanes atrovinosus]MDR7279264.1 RNA polymerase sigma-B factor [Catenuloplanes atrovinosus]